MRAKGFGWGTEYLVGFVVSRSGHPPAQVGPPWMLLGHKQIEAARRITVFEDDGFEFAVDYHVSSLSVGSFEVGFRVRLLLGGHLVWSGGSCA